MKKVAMIGVGKLGQDCAEVMAEQNDVVGYDVEPRSPSFPMRASIQEAVCDRDIIFIAAPTPHDPIYGGETPTSHLPNKDFDYTIVKDILTEVNKHVNQNQLVVLISTVLPGTVRSLLRPCITNARFIYNPYLIAMGTIKWDMVNPEMVIIGTEDGSITGDAHELIEFYKPLMENQPRYEVGTWDEAESIKIFYNTFISTKLALVNMIQDVAETNGNINVDVVTNALAKSNYRITGPAYMKAGLGDAGACHPRDNIALRYLADRLGLGYDLFDSIMRAREVQAENMALRCLKNGKNITIIGKAYKPGVHYTNGSASMLVGHYIEKHGGNVHYYDENTGDTDLREDWTQVYLIGYWEDWVERLGLPNHATLIDPWRKAKQNGHMEIIYYGDTRPKKKFLPEQQEIDHHKLQIYNIWPEIQKYDDQIHVIYANVHFKHSFVLRSFEDICEEILEAKANGKTKFFFHNMNEGAMPHIISKIHRIADVLEKKIDSKQLFYFSASLDIEHVYETYAQSLGWDKRINVVASDFLKYTTRASSTHFHNSVEYKIGPREKKFLCFNKLNREHRMVLLEKLLPTRLIPNTYYSFEGSEDFSSLIPKLDSNEFPNIKASTNSFPLRLNITSDRTNPVDIIHDDYKYFENSNFSVVTETLFYTYHNTKIRFHKAQMLDSVFFTEKIYKCFVLCHPFILLSRPFSLKHLKNIGYKTFSPYIDESYDEIEDDDKRLELVYNEILRLSNLTDEDMIKFQEHVKPIVDFNHQHFFGNQNCRVTELLHFFE